MCLKVHSYSRISNFSIPNKNEKLIIFFYKGIKV
ncbi:Uncharacterised protein [Streptococcus suis]|nr:Uncharacterised protein [Streptococcus suis]CYU80155.1 Uncharacterised protein [Streptococcus suis]